MNIPITEPQAQESNENGSDSNKDDNEQHENEPEHNDSNDNELNNKNNTHNNENTMNNNIIHVNNTNRIGGGYTFNAGNTDENTQRMVQRALDMIGTKYMTTGYATDETIEHSAFACSGLIDYSYDWRTNTT